MRHALGMFVGLFLLGLQRDALAQGLQIAVDPLPAPVQEPGLAGCPASCPGRAEGRAVSSIGLQGSLLRLRGSDDDQQVVGLTLAGLGDAYVSQFAMTARSQHHLSIGGGSGGLEGSFGADLAGGWRAPLFANHGPFARFGMRGEVFGNQELYSCYLEIPQLQIGYQKLVRSLVIEAAARGGPLLIGRYNAGEEGVRKLGTSMEWGGHAGVHVEPLDLEVVFQRVEARSWPETPVTMLGGVLCGRASSLALCMLLRHYQGDVVFAPGRASEVRSVYGGLFVGFTQPSP